ncbi:DHA2 family efflux MFS transporter permease subunit [Paenibacillus sp. HJGM_3]|uniref:DHA2 family efflux MFS transporter permease subunit n=1 Tax=Paenibacillus sp. HJGM_3 TaxID=3379816 RepID=UPI00385F0DD7
MNHSIQSSPRRWWVLGALAISLLTIGLDMTVLNLALPVLATDLHATTSELQWFANAYNLVLAAALLPAGMLGDRYGRKKLLLIALILFGAASAACAYATSSGALIAFRAILGLGAALLMPISLSLVPVLFSDEERPKAMRLWVTASALGMPLGPILGGWLLDHYRWGSIFLINLPIILIGILAVGFFLPESRNTERGRVHVSGIITSSLGLVAITYGVTRSGEAGWGDILTLASVIAGGLLLVMFVRSARRSRHPLVDLSLFREARFTWGATLATLVNFALFGVLFGLPLYLQAVQGVDAQSTGLRILPLIGGLIVGARLSGMLAAKTGDKLLVAIGFLIMAVGLGLGGLTGLETNYGYTALWVSLVGVGLGFALPAAMDAALGVLPFERSSVGSAVIMTMRQIGGTIGVAFLGALLNAVYGRNLDVDDLPGPTAAAVRDSVSSGVAFARQLDSAALLDSVRSAFVNGLDVMLAVCGAIAVLGFALTLVFWPKRAPVRTARERSAGMLD